MNYFFDPHARQELKDATLYLSDVDPSLGNDFAEEVERTIALNIAVSGSLASGYRISPTVPYSKISVRTPIPYLGRTD
jgi:hypothetical protein